MREVRISCPDATGLGVDLTRVLLDFGLRILRGDISTDGKVGATRSLPRPARSPCLCMHARAGGVLCSDAADLLALLPVLSHANSSPLCCTTSAVVLHHFQSWAEQQRAAAVELAEDQVRVQALLCTYPFGFAGAWLPWGMLNKQQAPCYPGLPAPQAGGGVPERRGCRPEPVAVAVAAQGATALPAASGQLRQAGDAALAHPRAVGVGYHGACSTC